jgi:hypothetical protein
MIADLVIYLMHKTWYNKSLFANSKSASEVSIELHVYNQPSESNKSIKQSHLVIT